MQFGWHACSVEQVLTQLADLLIPLLLAAALVTALLGYWTDAAAILLVALVNGVIGFVQEGRAKQALDAIRDMIAPHAPIVRDGRRLTVDAAAIVPGNIVLLVGAVRARRVRDVRVGHLARPLGRGGVHARGQHDRGDGDLPSLQRALFGCAVARMAGPARHARRAARGGRGAPGSARLHHQNRTPSFACADISRSTWDSLKIRPSMRRYRPTSPT